MNLGVTFAVAIGGLAYLGQRLDDRWDSEPWMILLGAVSGVAIGFINLFRVVSQISRRGQGPEGPGTPGSSGER